LGARLAEATKAYERDRFVDARKILKPLADRAPGSPAVRELYGLTLYRMGNWKLAINELEAFRRLTGSTEQHPVLADCYRALKRYHEVEALWDELKESSPSAELVAEGRIVAAGAFADQGEYDRAIRLLEAGIRNPKRLKPHHVRVLYVLADVVERAGDVPRARQLFRRVADADPEFADVQARLRALR
jgi:tetratricopeptide (TPR) repeat protein